VKARIHLLGDNVNEVHEVFTGGDPKSLEKWQTAFATLLKDALNDGVDLEVIVVRSSVKPQNGQEKAYIT
jgi:hypothetical protein